MNRADTSKLLTMAALVDNRPVTDEAVFMWHSLLEDIDYPAALDALRAYYRTSAKWLMPAHLRDLVEAARLEDRREKGRVIAEHRARLIEAGIDWVAFEQGDPAAIEKYKRAQEQGDAA